MGPAPLTPMAKQKQWMEAWSLTGRRLWTASGGMWTRSPWPIGRSSPSMVMMPRPAQHVVELVGRVGVGVDVAAALHHEFVDQLQEAAVGRLLHLPRVHHPPHRDGAVVLDDGGDVLDVAYVHGHGASSVFAVGSDVGADVRLHRHSRSRSGACDMGDEVRQITPVRLTGGRRGPRSAGCRCATPIRATATTGSSSRGRTSHVNRIGHRRDEVPAVAGGLRCEVLFRHATHTQVVMPLDVRGGGGGGPGRTWPCASSADVGQAQAFVLEILDADRPAPGHLALGPVPDRGRLGGALQRPGPALRRGQRPRRPRPPWAPPSTC